MEIKRGTVVVSVAGRDKDHLLAVVGTENGRVLVCDGTERPLRRPKSKNPIHIRITETVLPDDAFRGDRALKKALKECSGKSEVKQHV